MVTGSRGQLGHELMLRLAAPAGDPTPPGPIRTDLGNQAPDLAVGMDLPELDIADRDAVTAALREHRPEFVLNAAAWTAVDEAEYHEDEAFRANAVGPRVLARACHDQGVGLVHISTDYVFAGTATDPYEVTDPTDPQTAYGRTKAAGERAILAEHPGAYILRTAWVYGAHGGNFVRTMLSLAATRDTVDVVDDQIGSPTWTGDLAAAMLTIARSDAIPGIYHVTNSGQTSWFGFAQAIFKEAGLDPARVRPTTSAQFRRPAARPAYSVLSDRAWTGAGLQPLPPWREALGNSGVAHQVR